MLIMLFYVNYIGCFDQFKTNISFLYLLKISEKQRFFDVFRGYGKGTLPFSRYTLRI